jgi:hypothetical protein
VCYSRLFIWGCPSLTSPSRSSSCTDAAGGDSQVAGAPPLAVHLYTCHTDGRHSGHAHAHTRTHARARTRTPRTTRARMHAARTPAHVRACAKNVRSRARCTRMHTHTHAGTHARTHAVCRERSAVSAWRRQPIQVPPLMKIRPVPSELSVKKERGGTEHWVGLGRVRVAQGGSVWLRVTLGATR